MCTSFSYIFSNETRVVYNMEQFVMYSLFFFLIAPNNSFTINNYWPFSYIFFLEWRDMEEHVQLISRILLYKVW